ncbi:hypothetical protein LEM8419_00775 [Neolewinella maritima]|uniref:Glycosyl transferase family 28 C-terminal domain-containing protein n=1 Tax=Neolewinella maritima TaxID=1383882 RepID=A0ABM9AXT3_9BACT|nr:glycosyltransferase [Neolewinella maritima]CAH0999475.1 hypothetical protein LEM8419_00775 [Neolewinella maritima]
MSSPELAPVAFYVHHHGSGHATRTKLLAERWVTAAPIHVFTSAPDYFHGWRGGQVHVLPADVSTTRDPAADMLQHKVLHYAPIGLPGVQQRMAMLAQWIAVHQPALFIVDLSVEIALFVRLCGCRVALVRLHGHRDDPAHVAAFQLADHLIAPFPAALDDAHTPGWVREKTTYLGTFSRYDERRETKVQCRRQLQLAIDQQIVTVVNGAGGASIAIGEVQGTWKEIARKCPDWLFLLVGRVGELIDPPANLHCIGFTPDTFPYLKAADVVVGSGGTNTMMEVGAARVPFLSQPEPRPFSEQQAKMEALERLGLTRIVPPTTLPTTWPALLTQALRMDLSAWDQLPALPENILLG